MLMLNKQTDPTSYTGSSGVLKWRTPNYLRITESSPNKVINLDVEAMTQQASDGNGGFDRVYFEIAYNGAAVSQWIRLRSQDLRQPNYFDYASPLPGVEGGPAPFFGWGADFDLEGEDAGYIDITPRVQMKSGHYGTGDTLRIYNDTDGVDRRPSQGEVFVHADLGTPSGNGTYEEPVDTVQAAIDLLMPDKAISDAQNRNIGGAVINVLSDIVGMGGDPAQVHWHTGENHLTIRAVGGRHQFSTASVGTRVNADKLYGACWTGQETNVHFEGFRIEGLGFFVDKTGGASATMELRDVNCHSHSSAVTGVEFAPLAQYMVDDGQPTEASDVSNTTKASYGHSRAGAANGLLDYETLIDFRQDLILDQSLQAGGSFLIADGLTTRMRKNVGDVLGWFDVTGGTDFDIVAGTSSATAMRIVATDTGHLDFAFSALWIATSTYWGVKVEGATNAANNLSAATVTAFGYTGQGLPWIEVENASMVAETMTGSGRIVTTRLSDGAIFNTVIDPAMFTTTAAVAEGALSSVRWQDCQSIKGITTSGYAVNEFSMRDVVDGSLETGETNAHDFSGATFTHVLMENISLSSPDITFGASTFTGSSAVNCVFGFGDSNFITGHVSGCHFVTGTEYGINSSSGPFFITDPGEGDFFATPLVTQMRTASGSQTFHGFWDTGPRAVIADWVKR